MWGGAELRAQDGGRSQTAGAGDRHAGCRRPHEAGTAAFLGEGPPGPRAEVRGEGLAWPSSESTTQAQGHRGRRRPVASPLPPAGRGPTRTATSMTTARTGRCWAQRRGRHPLCPELSGGGGAVRLPMARQTRNNRFSWQAPGRSGEPDRCGELRDTGQPPPGREPGRTPTRSRSPRASGVAEGDSPRPRTQGSTDERSRE